MFECSEILALKIMSVDVLQRIFFQGSFLQSNKYILRSFKKLVSEKDLTGASGQKQDRKKYSLTLKQFN
jgi:hypothetical protein